MDVTDGLTIREFVLLLAAWRLLGWVGVVVLVLVLLEGVKLSFPIASMGRVKGYNSWDGDG
jgi:hypothetical protein